MTTKEKPIIIPIASGKGGVGKTFLTANLAIALAEMGFSTVVIDMDLGGSNLYSFLGIPNRFPGIGDYLKARNEELKNMLISTETDGLQYLPGDGRTPFLANIPHAQKIRLISDINELPATYVLLDLGPGTAYNTLDFFRISPYGIVVMTPEYPSIISSLSFLKHFIIRAIERTFSDDRQIRTSLQELYKESMSDAPLSIGEIQSIISPVNDDTSEKITKVCNMYRPRIVFNKGTHPDEMKISNQIDRSLQNIIAIEADYFGFIFDDPDIRRSVRKRVSFLNHYRESMAADSLKRIAERIVKYLDRPVKNSARLLHDHTNQLYEVRKDSKTD